MASTARQKQPAKRGGADPGRRAPAWTGARASPTFSPSNTPRPQNNQASNNANPNNFPSLGQANGTSGGGRPDPARDRHLQSLAGLTGTTVTLATKTGQRYEGVVGSTAPEGDMAGVTLKDVKDITVPGAPLKDSLFIASTNIDSWTSGPADSKPANGDSFRTDVEISGKKVPGRERELQAWVDSDATTTDADTFGGLNGNSNKSWDQFAANEQLFGVKATFDENVYTTPLNRDAPDYKERERKANQIAKDIMGTATNNPHIAEERGHSVDDSGINEEDKYGAVVRGAGAYVPPGARRGGPPVAPPAGKPEIPKVSVNGPDGTSVAPANVPSPVPANATATPAKAPADAVPAFREFVSNEKQRLTQKRQALVKNEMDKRMAELVKFSQSFKLNKPIPDDLVPILAKDEDKQKAIRDKAEKDAASAQARAIGASTPSIASRGVLAGNKPASKPNAPMAPSKTVAGNLSQTNSSSAVPKAANANAAASTSTAAPTAATKSNESVLATKKVSMVIQAIPPFKGAKPKAAPAPSAAAQSASNGAMSPAAAAANRLNVNAPSFKVKPGPTQSTASASPKPKQAEPVTPNPFFGSRPIKKGPPVNIKDDFNPFKHNKVADASQITQTWPYSGKRYMQMYPAPQHPPAPHNPHMPPPGPTPMPPPSYEEDQAAATAARGQYVYAYPGYYHGQPMMPGMPPPPGFMPGPYMQHMPYPPGMHPPNAMYSPGMAHMPPPGAYGMPPPGAYPPPPNGAGPRPSMPPTPMPSHAHAHPYYQQSPQMQHAVPYPMMMPPPQQGGPPVPHPYDGQQPPAQVQMGGHA